MGYDVYYDKAMLVADLEEVCKRWFNDIKSIVYHAYSHTINDREYIEEFIVLTWTNNGKSYANNNANSLSATAKNTIRMVSGGVYENIEMYEDIMGDDKWKKII